MIELWRRADEDTLLVQARSVGVLTAGGTGISDELLPVASRTVEKPRLCHLEECGEVMPGVEHDEAISFGAISMLASRLLRRHCPSTLPPALTPRNDNFGVFQQFHHIRDAKKRSRDLTGSAP